MNGQYLTPNTSPFPSMETNDPFVAPWLGREAPIQLGTVREDVALNAPDMSMIHTPQGPVNMLMELRSRFPFVPIMPLPSAIRALALVANVPQELMFPDGTMLMNIKAQVGVDYYMCLQGAAEVPSVTNTGMALIGAPNEARSFKLDERIFFYTGNAKSISCISAANCIITASFYSPLELPQ